MPKTKRIPRRSGREIPSCEGREKAQSQTAWPESLDSGLGKTFFGEVNERPIRPLSVFGTGNQRVVECLYSTAYSEWFEEVFGTTSAARGRGSPESGFMQKNHGPANCDCLGGSGSLHPVGDKQTAVAAPVMLWVLQVLQKKSYLTRRGIERTMRAVIPPSNTS